MAWNVTTTTTVSGGRSISISLQFADDGVLTASADIKNALNVMEHDVSIAWTITAIPNPAMALTSFPIPTGHALCVANCLGVAVGKAVIECLVKQKTVQGVMDCLKEKAVAASLDAAVCVFECFK